MFAVPTVVNASAEFLEEYYRTDTPPSSRKKRNSSIRVSLGLACGALVGGGAFIAATAVLVTKRNRRRVPNMLKKPFCPSLRNNSSARNNRRAPRLALALANCPPIHMLRFVNVCHLVATGAWRYLQFTSLFIIYTFTNIWYSFFLFQNFKLIHIDSKVSACSYPFPSSTYWYRVLIRNEQTCAGGVGKALIQFSCSDCMFAGRRWWTRITANPTTSGARHSAASTSMKHTNKTNITVN